MKGKIPNQKKKRKGSMYHAQLNKNRKQRNDQHKLKGKLIRKELKKRRMDQQTNPKIKKIKKKSKEEVKKVTWRYNCVQVLSLSPVSLLFGKKIFQWAQRGKI